MRRIAAILTAAVLVSSAARAAVRMSALPGQGKIVPEGSSSQSGIGYVEAVVGRLKGGTILYSTSLDVWNFSGAAVTTPFEFRGADVVTGAAITFTGTFTLASGGGPLGAFNNVHFDDFIHAATQAGGITPGQENDGVIGSLLILFEGVSDPSICGARARFSSQQFGGTIGVTLLGHLFDGTETTAVMGVFSDTTTSPALPHLYSNVFLTNLGQFDSASGMFLTSDDTVVLTAYSATTGTQIGQPKTIALGTGRTASVNLRDVGVPAGAGRVIVIAKATSGHGLLLGVGSENDADTKDPSGFPMASVSPSIAPPGTSGGDLASSLNGTWDGTWNNATFSTLGSSHAVISVNTTAHTFSATLTLGGNVFGGSAPSPVSFTGSYSTSTGVSFSGHDALFGDITFTITPAGAISGSATNVPSSNVSSVSFTGTATSTSITINYTIQLKPSGTATGTLTLTKTHS
ncbi:MAG TPA: hypothetical protein VFL12_03475 [Thermoanaerobaculia bacterium]|nr:hypothetical protein [Thermoanaerobaculia bacterium]